MTIPSYFHTEYYYYYTMTKALLRLLTGLLASQTAHAQSNNGAPGLHSLAVAAGKLFFGTATDTNNFNDTAYMSIVTNRNEFGILVPENSMKWQPTEPTQNQFSFTNPDAVRALAQRNNQLFRCHTLTWFQQLPQFILTTSWTRDTLSAAINTHIANVVGHYAGSCYSWDVVNEALNDGGNDGSFRNSVFFTTLGTDYIPLSFAAAAAADPAAKLYYNDFSLEFNGAKTDAALDIVRLVQNSSAMGARIDGIGFQAHLTVGSGTPSRDSLISVFNRFIALGLEVAITELDIRMTLPSNATSIEQQAQDYMSVVGACLALPKCVGLVVWQFTDKYSWVPSTFAGTGEACLYDQNMQRKPAWTSVSVQLAAAAATATPAVTGPRPGANATVTASAGGLRPTTNPPVMVSGTERLFVGTWTVVLVALILSGVPVMFA